MAFPKKVAIFTANFGDVGMASEFLQVQWNYPAGNPGSRVYGVGTAIFLETLTAMTQVPDEHLLASASMMAILAGEILPGTAEYMNAVVNQDTMNFQTIRGNAKLKTVTPVIDAQIGPLGTVFDIEFVRVGSSTDVKTVRADAWALSQYSNREDNASVSVDCLPGAVHKQFGFKKSQLGAENSANRIAVIDYIASLALWV